MQTYNFPELGVSVQAKSLSEATKLAKKEKQDEKNNT